MLPTTWLASGNTKSCGCLLSGQDSVQAYLNGTFRRPEKPCEFYIYRLANHALIKAGIDSTGNRADEEYGEQVLSIELPRFEAWLLEQAFLQETKKLASQPSRLADWIGRTEVRDMQEDEAIALAVRLQEDLAEMGVADFAAQYLPVISAQIESLAAA